MKFWELEPEWDDNNVEHIARHGVEPEEVDEIVFYEDCHPSWIVRSRRPGQRETRWVVFGQTCGGRYLIAVIAPYTRRGVSRAVTARGDGATYSTVVPSMAQKLTTAQRRAIKQDATAWDELSDADFGRLFQTGEPVGVRIRRPPPKTLIVALDEQTLNRLRRLARHKQLHARHLVAMWIAERLAQEHPAAK